MALGGKEKGKEIFPDLQKGQARDKAAKVVGANPYYVSDAKRIAKDAPEILDHVKQGKLRRFLRMNIPIQVALRG